MQETICEICSELIKDDDYVSEMNPFSIDDGWEYFHTSCYNDKPDPLKP